MIISSTIFTNTGDYSLVFLVAGGLTKVALALGFFKIEVERREAA